MKSKYMLLTLRVNGFLEVVKVYTLVDSVQLLMTYSHKLSLDVHVPVQVKDLNLPVI